MPSPFIAYAKATLTFQVPIWDASDVSDYGNPSAVAVKPFTVKALLKEVSARVSRSEAIAGSEDNFVYVEGYAADPMQLPKSIVAGAKADATINGKTGVFFMELVVPSPFGVEKQTGQKLRGRFVQHAIWGESA